MMALSPRCRLDAWPAGVESGEDEAKRRPAFAGRLRFAGSCRCRSGQDKKKRRPPSGRDTGRQPCAVWLVPLEARPAIPAAYSCTYQRAAPVKRHSGSGNSWEARARVVCQAGTVPGSWYLACLLLFHSPSRPRTPCASCLAP